jgi:hypothetical protein
MPMPMRALLLLPLVLSGLGCVATAAWAWPTPDSRAVNGGDGNPPEISDCEDLSSVPIRRNIPYTEIQDAWLLGGCVGCHNTGAAMGDLVLDSAASSTINLIGRPSYRNPDVMRVEPMDPEASLAYSMLNCTPPATYDPMPPSMSGTRIDIVLRARIYDWIAEGAKGNDEDGNPVSPVIFRDGAEGTRFQTSLAPPPPPFPASARPSSPPAGSPPHGDLSR